MSKGQKIMILVTIAAAAAIAAAVLIRRTPPKEVRILIGCVLRDDPDPRKQVPVADAEIDAAENIAAAPVKSESSGLFRMALNPGVEPGQTILLRFHHTDYEPLKIYESAGDQLYIIRMTPIPRQAPPAPEHPDLVVSNIRIRYAESSTTTLNVGSAGKTFEVVNTGNVPCNHTSPCSPDGKWKATIGGTSLDAGEGNEFQDSRLTCIAGPCPFTKVEMDGFSKGGRTISASVRNWSDPVSFLLEAQVVHTMTSDMIRRSYPVKLGRGMNFTLPPLGQGPAIEAEIGGMDIVYPLGPNLTLSWATCTLKTDPDRTKLYHCDLKPGYRFE